MTGTVLICPNVHARNALIKAIEATSAVRPVMKSDSVSAKQAHYAPAHSKLIINTASENMHQKIGRHSVAYAIEVADRVAAAKIAAEIFEQAGFEAKVFTQAEPEFPDGFLTLVSVPALNGITLMFWPRPEDVTAEIAAKLPEREPW